MVAAEVREQILDAGLMQRVEQGRPSGVGRGDGRGSWGRHASRLAFHWRLQILLLVAKEKLAAAFEDYVQHVIRTEVSEPVYLQFVGAQVI